MALFRQVEFAKLCGKAKAAISVNVSRGKIIKTGNFIDDTLPENILFIERSLGHPYQPNSAKQKITAPIKKVVRKKPIVKKETVPVAEVEPDYGGGSSTFDLDRQKKIAEIGYKEAQIRKIKLEEDKLRGLNLPTSIVTNVVALLGQSFQSSYKNGATMLLIDVVHKGKISVAIEAELKGKMIKLINESHENAILEAKRLIKNIIDEIKVDKSEESID